MVAHAYHPSMQEVKAEDENSKSAQDKRGYLKKTVKMVGWKCCVETRPLRTIIIKNYNSCNGICQ